MLLSGGDSLILRPYCGNVENLDRNHPMDDLYFGGIYDTLKPEVMRNENKKIVSKVEDRADEQYHVKYV